ncbi:hypothetical protein [Fodinicurvata halophila]|uniref:hypothetical protein n=1 Tax=Fodinicurvata halophila TaxID=1419723 RepID=UPI003641BA43
MTAARISAETETPLLLVSSPDAAAQGGCLWFLEILRQANAEVPAARLAMALDCGDAAGFALEALDCGITGVIYRGEDPVRTKLGQLAELHGASFLTERPRTLFLDEQPDPEAACRAWIKMESP